MWWQQQWRGRCRTRGSGKRYGVGVGRPDVATNKVWVRVGKREEPGQRRVQPQGLKDAAFSHREMVVLLPLFLIP